jgi:hypothetical protein
MLSSPSHVFFRTSNGCLIPEDNEKMKPFAEVSLNTVDDAWQPFARDRESRGI